MDATEAARDKSSWGLLGHCGDLRFNSKHERNPPESLSKM